VTFGARDPRAADIFHAEADHLTRGDDMPRTVQVESAFAAALGFLGQFERAHRVLDALEKQASDVPSAPSSIALARANLLNDEGHERDAVLRNRRTVEEVQSQSRSIWALAAALTNAALTEMIIGDLDEARESARRARELWEKMSHERGVALTRVVDAEVSRRRGEYAAAQAVLGTEPPVPAAGLEIDWYRTSAELAIDLGHLDTAAENLEVILVMWHAAGQNRDAAKTAGRLVEVYLRAGRYDDAERVANQLAVLMDDIQALRSHQSTPETEQADDHNGRAVRQLSGPSRWPDAAVRGALEHLEEALRGDPTSHWYSLNLAYAHLWLGNRKEALKALGEAVTKATDTPFAAPIKELGAEFEAFDPRGT
jgi:tetratricopeptide (TPR) repeat protein